MPSLNHQPGNGETIPHIPQLGSMNRAIWTIKRSGKIMDKIDELLTSQQLSTADTAITKEQQPQPSEIPDWALLLLTIAQDKRHDLDPQVIRLWKGKLSSFADGEICEALSLYRGEFFPSVDKIIEMIERKRLADAEQKQDLYWVDHDRNNRDIERYKAEHDGKTPQQVFVEENRELIRELDSKLVSGPANKKLLEQSRVLGCESESR